MSEYSIYGGDEGKRRLEILHRTIAPSTTLFLEKAALSEGMNCLDLGCGGGQVAIEIGRKIGESGLVTGLDFDERKIELAIAEAKSRQIKNVLFACSDAYRLTASESFDLVYSRFLLSHLSNPAEVVKLMYDALKPGGKVLIEDTDFSGHFSHPQCSAFDAYVSLYQKLLQKRGANANLGQSLAQLLNEAGFVALELSISQPVHTIQEGKQMAEITLEGISNALISESLITRNKYQEIQNELIAFRKREDTIMSLPRIFQVSAIKN